jgi:hypothetical protein
MRQQEIQFFWPLTEQVPLDLDYSDCEKPKLYQTYDATNNGAITYTLGTWQTGDVTITAANMNIDVDTTVIKVKDKPNLCRRTLYKCLGLKWEIK